MRRNVAAGKIRRSTSHTASMMISSPRLSVSIAVSKTFTNIKRTSPSVSPLRLGMLGGVQIRRFARPPSRLENQDADRGAQKKCRQLVLDDGHNDAVAEKKSNRCERRNRSLGRPGHWPQHQDAQGQQIEHGKNTKIRVKKNEHVIGRVKGRFGIKALGTADAAEADAKQQELPVPDPMPSIGPRYGDPFAERLAAEYAGTMSEVNVEHHNRQGDHHDGK